MGKLVRAWWWLAEASVTLGAVVLLLVVHQLWWTNLQARGAAHREVAALEQQWDSPPQAPVASVHTSDESAARTAAPTAAPPANDPPPAPQWDMAYAVIRIPAIGVSAPVAEGTSKTAVLNLGYVGHYPHTAQPGQPGNFALAGHRNTHGEPFRYINRLRPGDQVLVETARARFTYVVDQTVAQTSALDGSVIDPVPYSSVHPEDRMTGAGYYITLTTCTPEFTSRYRLVVWGRLTAERPR
ncbi:class E sortase [Streptantibioticus ferralitis]|uniref:Class E sortase n=1 Tax=Streptantibioticus ferralitis TaxID=236510 RepID=A0ABT5YV06_9ACTN|nr:class E sortase [Streptantibioticus ferralitis]MDF2255313.1 class E sortase [Streptantibioticus ferralitis]